MRHVLGSALNPIGDDPFVIAHIVNTEHVWGGGFVIPLGEKFPEAKQAYLEDDWLDLGLVTMVPVKIGDRPGWVAHLIAQEGIRGPHPLHLESLAKCIRRIQQTKIVTSKLARVHCPRIGCNRGGASWNEIKPLIPDDWIVYTLPAEMGRFPKESYESYEVGTIATATRVAIGDPVVGVNPTIIVHQRPDESEQMSLL